MASNNKYLPCAAVAICSMIDTKKSDTVYNIHILCTGVDADSAQKVLNLARQDVSISFHNISTTIAPYLKCLYPRAHFSKEMYFRWWIGELFPQYDKILYLDCDTVVLRDLSYLYQTDIGTAPVGGVVDFATPTVCQRLFEQFCLPAEQYINSGVLLINSIVWRSECLAEKCVFCLGQYDELACPDQDVLNLVCRNRIRYLDTCWNAQWHHLWDRPDNCLEEPFLSMFSSAIASPSILHFSSPLKPWNCPQTTYSKYFWQYAACTSFDNRAFYNCK